MKSWFLAAWAAVIGMPCAAQVQTGHPAGFVLTTDVDGDGCCDALIFEATQVHAWFGHAAAPWFTPGPTTAIAHDRRACEPVLCGRDLWLASLGPLGSAHGTLECWRVQVDGRLLPIVSYALAPSAGTNEVTSIRVAAQGFDFDNDGANDVLALWAEIPRPASSSMRAAWFSPSSSGTVFDLPQLQLTMHHHELVGLHRCRNLGQSSDDMLAVIAPPPWPAAHGVEFVTIARGPFGPVMSAEIGFGMAPTTRLRSTLDERARSLYGGFSPLPMFGSPVVQFLPGPSVAFDGSPLAPYVPPSGHWLDTSIAGALMTGAVADYDGDGADEIVLLDHLDGIGDVLVVTDPMPQSRRFQAFFQPSANWLVAHSAWPYEIVHAAPADVDGDGLLDLVVTLRATSTTGRIGLFRGVRPSLGAPIELVRVM
ncbi:MAG: VCBS repeat-containing protein [Planctomycetota bacterium]